LLLVTLSAPVPVLKKVFIIYERHIRSVVATDNKELCLKMSLFEITHVKKIYLYLVEYVVVRGGKLQAQSAILPSHRCFTLIRMRL